MKLGYEPDFLHFISAVTKIYIIELIYKFFLLHSSFFPVVQMYLVALMVLKVKLIYLFMRKKIILYFLLYFCLKHSSMYVQTYVYICMNMFAYTSTCVFEHTCAYLSEWICVCMCAFVFMCMFLFAYFTKYNLLIVC